MKKLTFIIFIVTFLLTDGASYSEVYRLTDNQLNDQHPQLLRDNNGVIWCFWLSENQLNCRYFDGTSWSEIIPFNITLPNFSWSIDIDRNNIIWLARRTNSGLFLFKRVALDSFALVDTFSQPFLADNPKISAFDSTNVWIDTFVDGFHYSLTLLHYSVNSGFQVRDTLFGLGRICDYIIWPNKIMKAGSNRVYILRDVMRDCNGTEAEYYSEVYKVTGMDEFSVIGNPCNAAITADGNLYFLRKIWIDSLNYQLKIEVLDTSADTVYTRFYIRNFYPSRLTRQGSFLAMEKNIHDSIFVKGIDDTLVYKTSLIPEDSLLGDHNRRNFQIITDSFPQIYLSWNGKINNQNEIFFAKWRVSTELDTENVVGFENRVSNHIDQFYLNQNYPNPFNSSTTISFTLPKSERVTIKVFDVLGREVSELLNEKKSAGTYEIKFDGSHLSSGIYFYSMQAGDFIDTKKFLLLK